MTALPALVISSNNVCDAMVDGSEKTICWANTTALAIKKAGISQRNCLANPTLLTTHMKRIIA
jgi:hypothetical protein